MRSVPSYTIGRTRGEPKLIRPIRSDEARVGAFSGGFRGFELVPSKWRSLVPPTSALQGHNASR